MDSYDSGEYTLRRLHPADWQLFQQIRLEALQAEPGVFSSNYAREAAFPDARWQSSLEDDSMAFFGLFYTGDIIGLTGIITDKDDPSLAVLIASYIRVDHRGKALSRLCYQARLDWARAKGFNKVQVSHRGSNLISRSANQRFGFVYTHTAMQSWPDGTEDEQRFYQLVL